MKRNFFLYLYLIWELTKIAAFISITKDTCDKELIDELDKLFDRGLYIIPRWMQYLTIPLIIFAIPIVWNQFLTGTITFRIGRLEVSNGQSLHMD